MLILSYEYFDISWHIFAVFDVFISHNILTIEIV
jgi:hypothetical protein